MPKRKEPLQITFGPTGNWKQYADWYPSDEGEDMEHRDPQPATRGLKRRKKAPPPVHRKKTSLRHQLIHHGYQPPRQRTPPPPPPLPASSDQRSATATRPLLIESAEAADADSDADADAGDAEPAIPAPLPPPPPRRSGTPTGYEPERPTATDATPASQLYFPRALLAALLPPTTTKHHDHHHHRPRTTTRGAFVLQHVDDGYLASGDLALFGTARAANAEALRVMAARHRGAFAAAREEGDGLEGVEALVSRLEEETAPRVKREDDDDEEGAGEGNGGRRPRQEKEKEKDSKFVYWGAWSVERGGVKMHARQRDGTRYTIEVRFRNVRGARDG
ncbi:hypothetical protein F4780DRAFT_797296 [Xylariomycetidae sp. FL0641]|nr:hypothetical protein F4780DRAFT_797296 [Xylariomycetidae sp. FL0641]